MYHCAYWIISFESAYPVVQWYIKITHSDTQIKMRHIPYTMNLFTMITKWMNTSMVIANDFPSKYSKAIYSQYAID